MLDGKRLMMSIYFFVYLFIFINALASFEIAVATGGNCKFEKKRPFPSFLFYFLAKKCGIAVATGGNCKIKKKRVFKTMKYMIS